MESNCGTVCPKADKVHTEGVNSVYLRTDGSAVRLHPSRATDAKLAEGRKPEVMAVRRLSPEPSPSAMSSKPCPAPRAILHLEHEQAHALGRGIRSMPGQPSSAAAAAPMARWQRPEGNIANCLDGGPARRAAHNVLHRYAQTYVHALWLHLEFDLGTNSGRECEMMLDVHMGMGLEMGLTAGLGMVLDMVLQKKTSLWDWTVDMPKNGGDI